jgi:hypothetical protein
MQFVLITVCFLFLCHGHGHKRQAVVSPCNAITQAYEDFSYSWSQGYGSHVDRDQFVTRYPISQQHRVLVCLDQYEKGRGLK